MEELVGKGDGIRQAGEPGASRSAATRAVRCAPSALRRTRRCPRHLDPIRLGSLAAPLRQRTAVEGRVPPAGPGPPRARRVGRIAAPLRARARGNQRIDPKHLHRPVGTDLLAGQAPASVTAGTSWRCRNSSPIRCRASPAAARSSSVLLRLALGAAQFQVPYGLGGAGCRLLPLRFYTSARRAELQATMDADMLDPPRSATASEFYQRWHWTSQGGALSGRESAAARFLRSSTREWAAEADQGGAATRSSAFVPIDRTAAVYDPANYDSPDVTHLVLRNRQPSPPGRCPTPPSPRSTCRLGRGRRAESDEAMLK